MEFCGIKFENPFVLAPSPFSDSLSLLEEALQAGWAGAVMKTVAVQSGNLSRVYPLVAGVEGEDGQFLAMENIDLISEYPVNVVADRVRALKRRFPGKVISASIMAKQQEDWQSLARRLAAAGADIIECSFACPHSTDANLSIPEQEPAVTEQIAAWVKEAALGRPVVVKLSSQVPDITTVAAAAIRGGADGVVAVNTLKSIGGVDLNTLIPLPNVGGMSSFGGLSGPAIKPVALRYTAEIAGKLDVDIAATGGITTWRDGVEFLLLGAKTLQVCTAVLRYGPGIIRGFTAGLQGWMQEKDFSGVSELCGRSLPYLVDHTQLPRGIQVIAQIRAAACDCCLACDTACRAGGHQAVITNAGRSPTIDPGRCTGCGICRTVCRRKAVEMVRRVG